MKKIYVSMSADIIHHGHINILKEAGKLGEITVGLLTDAAIAKYSRLPYLNFEQRKEIICNMKGIAKVIPQETLEYTDNLYKLKPDIVVHGDDWCDGPDKKIRAQVIETLNDIGGKLVEIPHTKDISSTQLHDAAKEIGTTPNVRLKMLRRLLEAKKLIRINEVHHGLSGLITEKTQVTRKNEQVVEFDGMWSSSLTTSTARGKPDIEVVNLTSRLTEVNEIFEVTTKPMIFDGDTGGISEHLVFTVRTLERLGVSAIVIEDKIGLKKNSLFGNEVPQQQDSISNFQHKIQSAKVAQITNDFMLIARIESLILDAGMEDALARAKAYEEAGADAIMIHSRQKAPDEIFEFLAKYRQVSPDTPVMVVPTSFNSITESEWEKKGANIVCYANHMLRSSYPAMLKVAQMILQNERSLECDELCLSIKEILELIPGTK